MDCMRSVYGDDRYYQKFYDVEYVRGRIDSIFIAELDGEVVGSLALSGCGYRGEDHKLGTFIVKADMEEHNIGSGLLGYTVDSIRYLPSVKGENVTHHMGSQILTERNGFVPVGLLFDVFIDNSTLLIIVNNFNVKEVGRIFVPDAIASSVELLYRELGVSVEPVTGSGGDVIPSVSDIWYEYDRHFRFADIYILSYGEDCMARIGEIESGPGLPGMTANIHIDMRDPNAPAAYEALMGERCVYAGFKPVSAGHEYIVLHRPGEGPVRYGAMKLTARSREMLTRLGVALSDQVSGR
ncbi:MAG: hypothetical protein LBO70_04095 [Clostridiales Family XIII bacterium]|nr:hypothetical protein [Clostridiales Family XIII bacterium]